MKIETSDIEGNALDWAVAKCEGSKLNGPYEAFNGRWCLQDEYGNDGPLCPAYSTDWGQGGPIIEREYISIRRWTNVPVVHAYMPQHKNAPWSEGPTPLIAAMRCYVASELGDEIDIPKELI